MITLNGVLRRILATTGLGYGGSGKSCFAKLNEAFGGPDFYDLVSLLLMNLAGGDGGHAADKP